MQLKNKSTKSSAVKGKIAHKVMPSPTSEYDPNDWQARNDADTLRRSIEIKSDPSRMDKATTVLKKEAEQAQKALKSFSNK